MALSVLQMVLIGALVLVVPLGIMNQIKMKNKKKAEEQMMEGYGQVSAPVLNPAFEETARNYILQYKSQFPRDSIKSGLLQMGISESDAEGYLQKYF